MERFNSKYDILTDGIDTNIMNDKKITIYHLDVELGSIKNF